MTLSDAEDLIGKAEGGNEFLLLRTEVGCEHERLVHLHVVVGPTKAGE